MGEPVQTAKITSGVEAFQCGIHSQCNIQYARYRKKRGSARQLLLVLDDLMELVTKSDVVSGLFTHGRHINVSVLYLTQNLFKSGSQAREIRLNTNYLILFRNIQDQKQIGFFAQ